MEIKQHATEHQWVNNKIKGKIKIKILIEMKIYVMQCKQFYEGGF